MHYRRVYREGGRYFFTVSTEKRRKIFADDDNVKRLRAAFKTVMQKRPFIIDAAVVLPDHLQLSGHFLSMTAIIQHAGDLLKRYSPSNIPIHLSFKIQTVKIKNNRK